MKRKARNSERRFTFSNMVVHWLKSVDQRVETRGFRKRVFEIMANDETETFCEEELKEMRDSGKCRFIPDAFLVDKKNRVVYIFEVEDTHSLDEEKLRKLINTWYLLDYMLWSLRLFLIDRYSGNWRTVPMAEMWHLMMNYEAGGDMRLNEGENLIDWEEVYSRTCDRSWFYPLAARARKHGN